MTIFADADNMHGASNAGEYTLIDTPGDEHHPLLTHRYILLPRYLCWKLHVGEAHEQIEKVA